MKLDERFTVRVEQLLGRRVYRHDGGVLGRIEEIRAEKTGDDFEVAEYHLGTGAMLERLGVGRLLGRQPITYIVAWNQLDLTDAARPTLACDVSEIEMRRQ